MIASRLPARRPSHILGLAAVLFAGLAIWPWLVPPAPSARPTARAETSAPATSAPMLPPLATYSAIVERPLFAPSRRPPPDAIAPSLESRYRLLGTVGAGSKRKAFVADGSRRVELSEGDIFDGQTVKEIGQDRIVLSSPAGDTVLKLKPAAPEPAKSQ